MIESVVSLIQTILNSLMDLIAFFKLIFELIISLISFIPNPFGMITLTFMTIYLSIFIFNFVKGVL